MKERETETEEEREKERKRGWRQTMVSDRKKRRDGVEERPKCPDRIRYFYGGVG